MYEITHLKEFATGNVDIGVNETLLFCTYNFI